MGRRILSTKSRMNLCATTACSLALKGKKGTIKVKRPVIGAPISAVNSFLSMLSRRARGADARVSSGLSFMCVL